jgi:hypothetical protein
METAMKRLLALAILWLAVDTAALAVSPWPAACITPITIGQTIEGTLTLDDCGFYFEGAPEEFYFTDVYSFTGTQGQQIAISMKSTAVDAWLDLYDVNDIQVPPLTSDDDGGGGTDARIPAGDGYFELPATGTYYILANTFFANQIGAYTLTLTAAGGGTPAEVTVTEFYHPGFDHYFITAYPDEAASLAAGNLPPWVATGKTFKVWSGPGTNITNVWRFFSTAFGAKSGHFYTYDPVEAQGLQSGNVWSLEADNAFYLMPSMGICMAGTIPLYRLYNNGQGDSPNHRYTIDPAVRTQMIAAGWVPEGNGPDGVFACVPA